MRVDRDRAERVAAEAFRAHGASAADAELTARVLVSADARGKGTHGLALLPRFVRGLEHGNVDPGGELRVVRDAGAAATLDGGARLGPVVATEAMAEATARAAEYGVGAVGARNGNHLGMLGYYTDRARREGYVAVGLTNTEPAMPPFGGAAPILGTNPIAVGLPTDPPFNLDLSTAAISRGAVDARRRSGEPLPAGVALGPDGTPTTDPAEALEGVLLPFGGAKGSGLAVAVEVLAGALVGAAMGTDVTGTFHTEEPCTKGDLFLAIDPAALAGEGFAERANAFLRELKASEPAAGVDGVRVPGERSIAADEAARSVEVEAGVWDDALALAGPDAGGN